MKAMLLAAGFGTRLKKLTLTRPKPLMPVKGEPIIFHTLRMLRKAGIHEAVINLHYLGRMIYDVVGNGRNFGLRVSYSWEKEILGTAGGVKKAQKYLTGERFLLINSDILCNIDLTRLVQYHKQKKGMVTMVVRKDCQTKKYGILKLDRDDRIVSVPGSPLITERFKERMFCGIHVLEREVFNYLRPVFSSIIHDFYVPALEKGEFIYGYNYSGFWTDIGTPEAYQQVK